MPKGELDRFIAASRVFCDWCASKPLSEPDEARKALAHLTQIYLLALDLKHPKEMDYEIEGKASDGAGWQQVYQRAAALPFQYYGSIFDPQSVPPEDPVIGDLADDIADIHRDLSEGLSLYDQGHYPEAEWSLWFSFQSHWGRHATGAIRALHCWCADTGEFS